MEAQKSHIKSSPAPDAKNTGAILAAKSGREFGQLAFVSAAPRAPARSVALLEKRIEALAGITNATVGVSAIHIESGRSVSVRGGEAFPMASAFKVPIAVQIMTLVDEGKLSLCKKISLAPQDLHPGSGTLSKLCFHPGLDLSVANLMELMLVISDNSAADILLREGGGAAVTTERMRQLGFNNIRLDRNTAVLIADWSGIERIPPEEQWDRDMWKFLYDNVCVSELAARHAQTENPQDTATPDEMNRLVSRLWQGQLVSTYCTEFVTEMLYRCQTGAARIKGMLPKGTPVANKTGTLGGCVNDMGVITLPDRAGHVALSVFCRGADRDDLAERAIAEISRTVFDYFLLVP